MSQLVLRSLGDDNLQTVSSMPDEFVGLYLCHKYDVRWDFSPIASRHMALSDGRFLMSLHLTDA